MKAEKGLKRYLRNFTQRGLNEQAKQELKECLKHLGPTELALAEQEFIQEGTGRQEMKKLCDVHLEVMKEALGVKSARLKLPKSHPLSILMDEHKVIKSNLKRLKRILERLKSAGSFSLAKRQVNTLKELSHFFLETEKHHQREEEAIFPRLMNHGITEPPEIFKEDHVEFKAKKQGLNEIAMHAEEKNYPEFLGLITPLIEFLTKNLEEHIYKEDNILYPMAFNALGKSEWPQVRKKFDAIGYCCFAPEDLK